jgi:hypothetical protein
LSHKGGAGNTDVGLLKAIPKRVRLQACCGLDIYRRPSGEISAPGRLTKQVA